MLWNPRWFPGTNLQDINLDWILKKVSALRGGRTGQYLCKKSDKDFDFGWKTGGGGGGGTSNYLDLDNKPSINNIELIGNKTASDLGLASASDIPEVPVQSVNGKTGAVVLSASDVGAYIKPPTGIPKIDLSSAVQESLDKADSAYSKPATGIPKTDLSSAVQESLVKADSAYSKPATGIPKTDLANDVQTSLNKADSALQAVPPTYRTLAEQDAIDAAQDAEVGIVITGKRPSMAVTAGQYVIVRGSTISGITDGLYTANTTLSPSTDVTAANLTFVSKGGLNSLSTRLDAAFKNITASVTGSTTAGENGWVYVPVTIPTGYRMIAVNSLRFIGTNTTYIVLRGFEVDNSNSRVTLFFKNTTTSTTINYTATVWITCGKSDLF